MKHTDYTTLFEATKAALEEFTGSKIKKDAKIRQFLTQQLGYKNEHAMISHLNGSRNLSDSGTAQLENYRSHRPEDFPLRGSTLSNEQYIIERSIHALWESNEMLRDTHESKTDLFMGLNHLSIIDENVIISWGGDPDSFTLIETTHEFSPKTSLQQFPILRVRSYAHGGHLHDMGTFDTYDLINTDPELTAAIAEHKVVNKEVEGFDEALLLEIIDEALFEQSIDMGLSRALGNGDITEHYLRSFHYMSDGPGYIGPVFVFQLPPNDYVLIVTATATHFTYTYVSEKRIVERETLDLLNYPELIPDVVMKCLEEYEQSELYDYYRGCVALERSFNKFGFTIDFDRGCNLFDLRGLTTKEKIESNRKNKERSIIE